MASKKFYLTKKGLKKLRQKYKDLMGRLKKLKKEGEVPKLLHSEDPNPEYLSFQEDLNFLEARISKVEKALANAELIEKPPEEEQDEVQVGATVKVEVNGEEDEFTIVGSAEAAPSKGKISNECPVGQALLGSKAGDEVTVNSKVKTKYKIKEINY
ncbi:MAG: GreA/GreB family elongation factor [Candidatus Paceibacterota bacterium]